jgi:hypothetical protein
VLGFSGSRLLPSRGVDDPLSKYVLGAAWEVAGLLSFLEHFYETRNVVLFGVFRAMLPSRKSIEAPAIARQKALHLAESYLLDGRTLDHVRPRVGRFPARGADLRTCASAPPPWTIASSAK